MRSDWQSWAQSVARTVNDSFDFLMVERVGRLPLPLGAGDRRDRVLGQQLVEHGQVHRRPEGRHIVVDGLAAQTRSCLDGAKNVRMLQGGDLLFANERLPELDRAQLARQRRMLCHLHGQPVIQRLGNGLAGSHRAAFRKVLAHHKVASTDLELDFGKQPDGVFDVGGRWRALAGVGGPWLALAGAGAMVLPSARRVRRMRSPRKENESRMPLSRISTSRALPISGPLHGR